MRNGSSEQINEINVNIKEEICKFIKNEIESGCNEIILDTPINMEKKINPAPIQTYKTQNQGKGSIKTNVAKDRNVLLKLYNKTRACKNCSLCETRTKLVFGAGNYAADIMFIGEAPGREEDLQGLPFVGKAGELLTKILGAINIKRDEVFITNVLKCRPPENRDPLPYEIEACKEILIEQIRIIIPKIICTLGRISSQILTGLNEPISQLRGRKWSYNGIPLIATYHPAALLRNAELKRPTWDDVRLLRMEYDKLRLRD
jgi:DNA polymerase